MKRTHLNLGLDTSLNRRTVVGAGVATAAALAGGAAMAQDASDKTGVDSSVWTPEHIQEIAGTLEVDTKVDVAKVTPLDHAADLNYWLVGPTEASPPLEQEIWDAHLAAWTETYPNIPFTDGDNLLNVGYNDLLDKIRTAATGSAAPAVAKIPILWGSEFAARGQLREIDLAKTSTTQQERSGQAH